jgi:L-fuconolactonase
MACDSSVVDAHVHVWRPDHAHYPWLAAIPQLQRDFELTDVADEHAALGIGDVVLVQAADNVEDTENLLRVATEQARVAGIVVWVPLRDPPAARRLLDGWRGQPVVGARHLVHREPDPDWLLESDVQAGLAELADRGLTFDVCAESEHLMGLVPELARRHPGLTLVVDHLGKPPIAQRGWQPWADLLAAAAAAPNVVAKVSGLNTAASAGWSAADLHPYVQHAVRVFGAERLMYGGDWPFALQAAQSYSQIWQGIRYCLNPLTPAARQQVLAGTARRVYGLADRARR